MKKNGGFLSLVLLCIVMIIKNGCGGADGDKRMKDTSQISGESETIVFAAYAESDDAMIHVLYLAESIREFGGKYNDAPIWAYIPDGFNAADSTICDRLKNIGVGRFFSFYNTP